eukprot:121048_1
MALVEVAVLFVACLICLLIFCIDLTIRKTRGVSTNNIYQKWLHRFSAICMLSCIVRLLFLLSFEIAIVCEYINPKYSLSHTTIMIIFGFYQISRLQYCFKDDYPKCVYILLYLSGLLLVIASYITNILATTIIIHPDTHECQAEFNDANSNIFAIWYYAWDITVIILFVVKLKQIQKQSVIHNWKKQIAHKTVDLLLHKVLALTLFIEIFNILMIFGFGFALSLQNEQHSAALIALFSAIDIVLITIVMFLMVEHNTNTYIKIVGCVTAIRLCCCCQTFIYKTIPAENDNHVDNAEITQCDNQIKVQSSTGGTVAGNMSSHDHTNTSEVARNNMSSHDGTITAMTTQAN